MSKQEFLFNQQLPFIKQNFPGNLFEKGEFKTEYTINNASLLKVLKWKLNGNSQAEEKRNSTFKLPVIYTPDALQNDADKLVWLGHAAFFLQLNGVKILFDPCFEDLPFIKRKVPVPYGFTEFGKFDFVLLSHAHRDHLDKKSIGKLLKFQPEVQFIVPLKTARILQGWGAKNITEMGWYQRFEASGITIDYLPSQHWNKRGLNDFNQTLWGGFSIKTKLRHVFYAGDTGYHPQLFKEIHEAIGSPDVAVLPIGAYMPPFMMRESHINPEEAAVISNQIKAKTVVPMHYGTYDLSDEPMGEPIQRLRKAKENGFLHAELKVPAVGEVFYLVSERNDT